MSSNIINIRDYPILFNTSDTDKFIVLSENGDLYLQSRSDLSLNQSINLNTENILSGDSNMIPTSYAVKIALLSQIDQYLTASNDKSPSSKVVSDLIGSLIAVNTSMQSDINEIKNILLMPDTWDFGYF